MTTIEIKRIGIHLSSRHGNRKDYKINLHIYDSSDLNKKGLPSGNSFPLAISERSVEDVIKDGWYTFDFKEPLIVEKGIGKHYSIILFLTPNDIDDQPDFGINYIDWHHSKNKDLKISESETPLHSFSSDMNFGSNNENISYSYGHYSGNAIYGYGYGYSVDGDLPDFYDYFDLIGFSGEESGQSLLGDPGDYSYGPGWELGDFVTNQNIQRNFKIYGNFNDIEFVSESGEDRLSNGHVKINIPSANIKQKILNNRQDFVKANMFGTEVINQSLCLDRTGKRIYFSDITNFDKNEDYYDSTEINWLESNLFLSINDLNDIDIINPINNENYFGTYIVSSPYYSGVFLSKNGGNTWENKTYNLIFENKFRNIQSVAFDKNQNYIMAIDNSGGTESSKVFVLNDIINDENWIEQGKIGEGVISNKIISLGSDIFFVASNLGVYKTEDKGTNWIQLNSGLDTNTEVYDISNKKNDLETIIIATSTGTYVLKTDNVWKKIENTPSYSVYMNSKHIYIGTENGIIRSVSNNIDEIFTSNIIFEGKSPTNKNYYAIGILKQKVTSILGRNSDDSEIYISQNGGVFVSKNNGNNFINVSNKLLEKKVKKIINNPINNRMIYCSTETTKFSRAGVTIILDTSGSSFSNDSSGRRIDFLKKVIYEINEQAKAEGNTAYFQLITFGIPENQVRNIFNTENKDIPGVTNETGGYTSDLNLVTKILESYREIGKYYRTPLNEALRISSIGIENNASTWRFNQTNQKYEFENMVSSFLNDLDRSLILVTDGFNTVLSDSLKDMIGKDSPFSRMRGDLYIVGIGHNINYNVLNEIKNSHKFGKLYTQPYPENITNEEEDPNFKDAVSILLEKEKFRKKTGKWEKIINYKNFIKIKELEYKANIPPNTFVEFYIRSSSDKNLWGDWEGPLQVNTINNLDLYGKHFEIKVLMTSYSSKYSPEIFFIKYLFLEPSESIVYYESLTLKEKNKINEIILTSIDDSSLGVISKKEIEINYGILQSDYTDFSFYKEINKDKRSVVGRKEHELLITKDGFFFYSESGPWPSDLEFYVYDITEKSFDVTEPIDPGLYDAVPEKGIIYFYKKVDKNKQFSIKINFNENKYRLGFKAKNYTETNKIYKMYEIGWMFLDDKDSFLKNRQALPFVGSQLSRGNIFGFASPNFPYSSPTISNVITLQYISRERYQGGTISVTNGKIKEISTNENKITKFYDQNFGLSSLQSNNPETVGFVNVISQKVNGLPIISNTDSFTFKKQIDLSVSSLEEGESFSLILGDNSKGGDGLPSSIFMENLLFEKEDPISCEYSTSFVFGISNTSSSVSTKDNPISFDKPLSPEIQFSGNESISLIIFAPTTANVGSSFKFVVIVVDSNGFIHKTSSSKINLSLSDPSVGSISLEEYSFNSNDFGKKIFSGIITSKQIPFFTIRARMNGIVFESNPIVLEYKTNVKWGDINVNTLFSKGRQDIDFAIDYAKNTSLLDFIGIADDIELINQQEFDYIRYKASSSNNIDFTCLAGFKYRCNNSHGERVILFSNPYDSKDTVPILINPKTINNEKEQIKNLVNRLEGDTYKWDYISMPIHTAYTNNNNRPAEFDRRSFNFENYRLFSSYVENNIEKNNIEKFIEKESIIEIYSDHGNIENNNPSTEPNIYGNSNFINNSISHYARYALKIGKRFGFTANAGNYGTRPGYYSGEETKYVSNRPIGLNYNRGLTAINTNSIRAENLIESIRNRNTYATTGARIFMEFYAETIRNGRKVNANMGDILFDLEKTGERNELAKYPNKLFIRAIGDKSNIARIIIYKIKVDSLSEEILIDSANTNVDEFNSTDFGRDTKTLSIEDNNITSQDVLNSEYIYYAKVIQQDGQIAWASPIYFNYGRNSGIRTIDSIGKNSISGPIPLGISNNINGIPTIFNGNSGSNIFPQEHRNILINTNDLSPKLPTRRTGYKERYLYVGNISPTISAIRLLVEENNLISYGTHHPKFVIKNSDIISDINSNFNEINKTFNNKIYDTLNNEQITRQRIKSQRDFLFGTVWQYNSSQKLGEEINFNLDGSGFNVFSSSEIVGITKDPYIYKDINSNRNRMFFVSSVSAYPESNILQKDLSEFPVTSGNIDYDSLEEFAGFTHNASNTVSKHSLGLNFRICHTDDNNSTTRSFNFFSKRVPNNFLGSINESGRISYISSPNLIEVNSEYKYHLYFLGWILGPTNLLIPGMFVRKFNQFDDLSNEGPIDICFLFQSSPQGLPTRYIPRVTDFNAINFIPKNLRLENDIHPIHSYPWRYLSVIKGENNVIYAFINYLNRLKSSENLGEDSPGTAIIYSFDGINFYEKNRSDNVKTLEPLKNKTFVHPFKYFGEWYMSYRESLAFSDVGIDIRTWPLKICRFNMINQFEDNTNE